MQYPKIHLAIDNCFAFKRWTRPMDWAHVIKDLGVKYVEASADTELDPLFMGRDYLKRWVGEARRAEAETGVRVANLYSGHGTYCTLGLTHTDAQVRRRIIDDWFKAIIDVAAEMEAGMGFFAHAFADFVLQDRTLYAEYVEILYEGLSELNAYAAKAGCRELGVEQMYSPHLVPWRIGETEELMREVTKRSGRSFYITEDVGHHHVKFVAPTEAQVREALTSYSPGAKLPVWLGTDEAYRLFNEAAQGSGSVGAVMREISDNPHMFAQLEDGDCFEWLRRVGCYSPIIHLQQTNGFESAHKHFTPENNAWGKVTGPAVLEALKASCDAPEKQGMPERCKDIYLTLEVFTGTASRNHDTLTDYRTSVEYWRQFIPQDGLTLDKLV
jgi:sugar phosphate isomerase/epimerase